MNGMPVETTPNPEVKKTRNTNLPGTTGIPSIVRNAAAAVVPYVSYGANRLGGIGIIGVALLICSAMAFITANIPLRQQLAVQEATLDSARTIAAEQRSGIAVDTPQQQAEEFVSSLPNARDVPDILTGIVAVAATTGLELQRGTYELVMADGDAISRYQMSLPVAGSYPKVRRFIEDVLATMPTVALESMRIERDEVSNQIIAADLKFSILLGGV